MDVTGDRHVNAKVPDEIVVETVKRYKSGGVSQQKLADELTERGWPTSQSTVRDWVMGRYRSQAPNVLNKNV